MLQFVANLEMVNMMLRNVFCRIFLEVQYRQRDHIIFISTPIIEDMEA